MSLLDFVPNFGIVMLNLATSLAAGTKYFLSKRVLGVSPADAQVEYPAKVSNKSDRSK